MYDRLAALTVARLDFTEAGYPGLTVRVVRPTLAGKAAGIRCAPRLDGDRDDAILVLAELAPHLADSIVSWTLRFGARKVPPTRRGVLGLDEDLALLIMREWLAAWPRLERPAEPAAEPEPAFDDSQLAEAPMLALVGDSEVDSAGSGSVVLGAETVAAEAV